MEKESMDLLEFLKSFDDELDTFFDYLDHGLNDDDIWAVGEEA